jgi:hypothetical protein
MLFEPRKIPLFTLGSFAASEAEAMAAPAIENVALNEKTSEITLVLQVKES